VLVDGETRWIHVVAEEVAGLPAVHTLFWDHNTKQHIHAEVERLLALA
jgi:hypothetical protein